MSHKFTQGPWSLGKGYKIAKNHAVCCGPQILAKVNGFGYPISEGWSEESEANARLMANAPKLLDALEKLEQQASNTFHNNPQLVDAIKNARDAISEATD